MADFISDEEMAKLDQTPDFLSDDEMSKMEMPATDQQSSLSVDNPSTFRSIGEGLTMGFSGELAGGIEALAGLGEGLLTGSNRFGDEGRLAALKSFSDNYLTAQKEYDAKREIAAEQSPGTALLSELAGGVTSGIASAPALAAKGLGLVAQGAAQGALTGLGKSEKSSIEETAKDAAFGGAVGGLFSWGLGKLFNSGKPPITQGKDGAFKIQVGQNSKDVFNVSREMAEGIASPEAQNAIRAELNAQANGLKAAISSDFKSTEALKQLGLSKKGALPSKGLGQSLNEAWDAISSITPENDEVAVKALEGLKTRFKDINKQLITKSPSGNFDDVPLSALEETRSELGDIIFNNKAYNNNGQVKRAAIRLWGKLTDVLTKNDVDPITKEAGELTKALTGQRALFKALDEVESLPSGDWIKALANPSSSAGLKRFQNLISPLEDLAKKGQSDLVPNLSSYISNDFNKAVLKARVSNMVLGEAGSKAKLSPKQVLGSLISGYKNDAFSKAGAAIGSLEQLAPKGIPLGKAVVGSVEAGLKGAKAATPYVAGSLGSLFKSGEEP